jgi:hypothetical protein
MAARTLEPVKIQPVADDGHRPSGEHPPGIIDSRSLGLLGGSMLLGTVPVPVDG